jgi:hypothetical protein
LPSPTKRNAIRRLEYTNPLSYKEPPIDKIAIRLDYVWIKINQINID